MYGHLNVIVKRFVLQRYGQQQWDKILKKAQISNGEYTDQESYKDDEIDKLLNGVTSILGFRKDAILTMIGEYYFDYIRETGHDELLRNLGSTFKDFLENLDYVHTYMTSDYPDMKSPSFRLEEDLHNDKMLLHYYSFREGFYPLIIGILKAVAKAYYNQDLIFELILEEKETICKQKNSKQRDHVILAISTAKARKPSEAPPTMVAQTKKHGERQILKQHVDEVAVKIDKIRREQGEDALPVNKARAAKAKWKSIARMTMLSGEFSPLFPKQLTLEPKTFCTSFPYHLVLNRDMHAVHGGIKLQELMPGIRSMLARADFYFDLLHPSQVDFTYQNVRKFINTPFIVRCKKSKMKKDWGDRPPVILRGQMVPLEDDNCVMYLCSPFVRSLNDLECRRMYLADIPIHDVTRDMLWGELLARYRMKKTPEKGRSAAKNGGGDNNNNNSPSKLFIAPAYVPSTPGPVYDTDNSAELARLRLGWDEEKRRNADLYKSFLPPKSVAQWQEGGRTAEAGKYDNVSILFSDIVAFSSIISKCKPNDVVNLLTKLQAKYREACTVHETYRVETIGDGYMVVCGCPEELASHDERIANTALAMLLVCKEVNSPYDYGDKSSSVKIRIGIHIGSVISGVLGERIPRFTVMGENVNLASRMESHGLPGKIQTTSIVHEKLKEKGFRFEKRGQIYVRGNKKETTTYWLTQNDKIGQADLLGRRPKPRMSNNVEVTFINEGRQEDPPPNTPKTAESYELVTLQYQDTPKYGLLAGANVRPTDRSRPRTGSGGLGNRSRSGSGSRITPHK